MPARCRVGAGSLGVPLGSSWGPPGVLLGTTFCYSQSEIYDIGTEILIFRCFATQMLKSFCKSMIFSGICSIFCVLSFCSIKTWFKALWDIFSKMCMRPSIRSLSKSRHIFNIFWNMAAAPLCSFFSDPKLFRLVLKSLKNISKSLDSFSKS